MRDQKTIEGTYTVAGHQVREPIIAAWPRLFGFIAFVLATGALRYLIQNHH